MPDNGRMIVWFTRHAELCAEQARQSLEKASQPDRWSYPSEYVDNAQEWATSWLACMHYLEQQSAEIPGTQDYRGRR